MAAIKVLVTTSSTFSSQVSKSIVVTVIEFDSVREANQAVVQISANGNLLGTDLKQSAYLLNDGVANPRRGPVASLSMAQPVNPSGWEIDEEVHPGILAKNGQTEFPTLDDKGNLAPGYNVVRIISNEGGHVVAKEGKVL